MSGETEKSVSGWTIDTLRSHLLGVIEELSERANRQFAGQERAVEIALRGQERAVEVALSASNKEFHEHLSQARIEAQTALAAVERTREIQMRGSERALDIASKELDERMAKLNEFRGALADAQATMIPRAEAKLLVDAIGERLEAETRQLNQRVESNAAALVLVTQDVATLRARLAAQASSSNDSRGYNQWVIGTVVVIAVSFIQVIVHYLPIH